MMEQAIKSKHTVVQWMVMLWPDMWSESQVCWRSLKRQKYIDSEPEERLVCQAKYMGGNGRETERTEKMEGIEWFDWDKKRGGCQWNGPSFFFDKK